MEGFMTPMNFPIALNHLDRMTDSTGLIQHAIYSIPRRDSGYTTDDNARALRLCVRLWNQHPDERMLKPGDQLLELPGILRAASAGGFHNFLGYDRNWLDIEGCGDCQGQAVRALAEVLGSNLPDGYRAVARELIEGVLPTLADLRSLRAQAYVILAYGHLWNTEVGRHRTAGERSLVGGSAAGRMLWPCDAARLAVVRVADDLCQRGLAARAVHRREAMAAMRISSISREESFTFLDQQTTTATQSSECPSSGPLGMKTGIRVAKTRHYTINSPWKRSRWPKPRRPRSICLAARNIWRPSAERMAGFMVAIASHSRWSMWAPAPAATDFRRLA